MLEMAKLKLSIDESLVRKDLKYVNNAGKCRVGYNVKQLKIAIEEERISASVTVS